MPVKLAEVQTTMFTDAKKTDPLWLLLNKTVDSLRDLGIRSSILEFTELKLLEDVKKGDEIKITFEKM